MLAACSVVYCRLFDVACYKRVIHEWSKAIDFKIFSFSIRGGFLILNLMALAGTFVCMVNCEPCGCQVNFVTPVSACLPIKFPLSLTSQMKSLVRYCCTCRQMVRHRSWLHTSCMPPYPIRTRTHIALPIRRMVSLCRLCQRKGRCILPFGVFVYFSLLSITMVTGPSFTSSTCMSAPKTPVATGFPKASDSRRQNVS